MKILNDTLKNPRGKWSRKSLTAFASFAFAVSYEAICMWTGRGCNEYVFNGLLMLCAACLGLSVWDKQNNSNYESE